eukprot:GHRQ01016651.1.p5 GENE.GHRQ01016651.1~~GHRQ01016651.1.p5  ORF type:complete len:101 (+),score=23.27 GHRQ01016651.1:138-440(+)
MHILSTARVIAGVQLHAHLGTGGGTAQCYSLDTLMQCASLTSARVGVVDTVPVRCIADMLLSTPRLLVPLQWYGLVANAEFFCNDVQNEAMAEQLRERVR